MTTNKQKHMWTYPGLLKSPYELKLFKYYVTGQLTRINIDNGQIHKIGKPAMIRNIDVAPSGKYVMVQTLRKPFSYSVPVYRFARKQEVWNLSGNIMSVLQKRDLNLNIPHHRLSHFKRKNIKWRPDGKGVSMIVKSKKIVQWMPPFNNNDKKTIYKSNHRIQKIYYSEDSNTIFVKGKSGSHRYLLAYYPDSSKPSYTIYKYNRNNFYKNPGQLLQVRDDKGLPVVQMTPDKQSVFLTGTQYYKNPEKNAPRPFIDKIDIQSGNKHRIFQSSENIYENFTAALDNHINQILVSRQSSGICPNYWVISLNTGKKKKITSNKDYNKDITNTERHRFKVKRADGFKFWITVILPEDWDGKPQPGIIYQYPTDYKSQKDYNHSKRRYNKNKFPKIFKGGWPEKAPEIFIKQGYAVVKADWPFTSNQGSAYNGLVWSIQQNSTAVIDSLTARGYVDPNRMAIIGHSFGGFGVVNAMAHTSFFKAGIAGDDAYNRTLTPFGFQHQYHLLWNDLSKYIKLSPLFWADHLDGALMLYHGGADQNLGTWPIQSWRLLKR
jgi:dipeptidyl aminopeptidase/acylaminoacyl peptidase